VREPMAHNPRFVDETGVQLHEEREDFGLAAVFADLTGDGAPELYVAMISRIRTSSGSMTATDTFV